jgi:NADH dehydrogenase
MRILIAGKGFIGTSLEENLSRNHKVDFLDKSEADYVFNISKSFDIEDNFDLLIHAIGLAPGFYREDEYRQLHVEGTKNLLNGVEADKIIYLSALKAGEIDHSFFRTKKQAEDIIKDSGMDYTIIRPSTVYGEENKLLDLMGKLAFTRTFPNVKLKTQPIHIEDLVEIVSESVSNFDNEILRAAGPEKMTVGELGKRVYHQKGFRCLLIPFPTTFLTIIIYALSFLPPPFKAENIRLLRAENTTERNDATKITSLTKVP